MYNDRFVADEVTPRYRRLHDTDDRPLTGFGCGDGSDSYAFSRSATVLITGDDPRSRLEIEKLLSEHGWAVDEAEDGEIALALLTGRDYDAVLLDLCLCKVSGISIMAHLLQAKPELLKRIVVVTGVGLSEIRDVFPQVCDAISKPVMPSRLLRAIEACSRQQGSGLPD